MPGVVVSAHTVWGGRRLRPGDEIEVDLVIALRWERAGIATSKDRQEPGEVGGNRIPADFPGHQALLLSGYTLVEQVLGMNEKQLIQIRGIGQTTARRILESLEG